MPWINSRNEHARRTSGEFSIADGWIGSGHDHDIHDIQRIYDNVETWGIKSRITRVLTDVPDLVRLIIGVLDQAKQFGFTRRARLSWFDETPNQLLLEIPATPDLASGFLDQIDQWMIDNYAADLHRRLIIDVCFPA